MKTIVWVVTVGFVVVLGFAGTSAAVNCEQVRRYAKTGRSVDDIAESMIVDKSEVKKCLEGGEKDAAPTPAAAPDKK